MFGPIGMQELIIIFIIALLVFGPRKLPELGKSLGKSLAEFKRASNDLKHTLEEEVRLEETRRDLVDSMKESTPAESRQPTADSNAASAPPAVGEPSARAQGEPKGSPQPMDAGGGAPATREGSPGASGALSPSSLGVGPQQQQDNAVGPHEVIDGPSGTTPIPSEPQQS